MFWNACFVTWWSLASVSMKILQSRGSSVWWGSVYTSTFFPESIATRQSRRAVAPRCNATFCEPLIPWPSAFSKYGSQSVTRWCLNRGIRSGGRLAIISSATNSWILWWVSTRCFNELSIQFLESCLRDNFESTEIRFPFTLSCFISFLLFTRVWLIRKWNLREWEAREFFRTWSFSTKDTN